MTTNRIDPEAWYLEDAAAKALQVAMEALKNARYRKKVKSRKFCGVVQYMGQWLIEFREGPCESNQNSSDEEIHPAGSSMSPNKELDERAALVRAKLIIAKQNLSSRNGSSNAGSRS
jgi:hypothetical protein